jgi:anti-sigma B factor antagonist
MPSPADTEGQRDERHQGPPPFSLVQRDLDSRTCAIAVAGELDLATTPGLRRALDSALDAGSRIVVDLADTVFLDSTALSVLLDAARRLADAENEAPVATGADSPSDSARLAIVCVRPNVLRIFEFSGLDGAFAIFATLDDALSYARRGRTAPCAG